MWILYGFILFGECQLSQFAIIYHSCSFQDIGYLNHKFLSYQLCSEGEMVVDHSLSFGCHCFLVFIVWGLLEFIVKASLGQPLHDIHVNISLMLSS